MVAWPSGLTIAYRMAEPFNKTVVYFSSALYEEKSIKYGLHIKNYNCTISEVVATE